jgi:glycosyltransferase involved in cell wall biosynthesis
MIAMRVSVIISTYNQPSWLEKVLWGYENQTHQDFEVVIADDGSGEATRNVIDRFKKRSALNIKHIWHEDVGYRKCQILNKAIQHSACRYLIFTDGDCIPRRDFIEQHVANAEPGFFLSGGALRLPLGLSRLISEDDILSGSAFNLNWLRSQGLPGKFLKNLKLVETSRIARILNSITPAKATWNGGNASGWKKDIIDINGFDERMEYGGQDREFGERLFNKGLRSKQIRYSAACIHLDHGRSYKTDSLVKNNKLLRMYTRLYKSVWTAYGIRKVSPSFS